jgi:hypothetical protein
MNSKLLTVAFIAILLYSALNVTPAMAQCPTCKGTGKVVCPDCNGTGEITIEDGGTCDYCSGAGTLKPTLILTSTSNWLSDGKVFVQVKYRNEEDASTYGRVTAEVEAQSTTYTAISSDTLFPPHEETQVSLTIEEISSADYNYLKERQIVSPSITLDADNIVCPHCDGTGLGAVKLDCPPCGGTGFINCPTCGGSGVVGGGQNENLNIPLDVGGAAVGVAVIAGVAIAAFVVVKKRKVSEKDLRKLPLSEFQNWILKKLVGKSSSTRDSSMGIDGYTSEGQPISIKQSDGVDSNVIDRFAAAMGRSKAKSGIIVAFSFGGDAFRGKVRAKLNYGLEIQMVTVRDLIEGRTLGMR